MDTQPLVYYDIASGPPVRTYAPNPSKARYALNIKRVPFTTSWVELPDITKTRKSLGVPPCRKFADGQDFYTLPILRDPNTDTCIGDSFDIAVYLEKTYPDSGESLFPSDSSHMGLDYTSPFANLVSPVPLSEINTTPEYRHYARFNREVDATFTAYVILFAHGMPFNPATAEVTKAASVARAGMRSWDDLAVTGEKRVQMMGAFEDGVASLAALFAKNEGPFLEGKRLTYADVIVCGWLRMIHETAVAEEWEQVASWHGGVFGKLYEALSGYFELK
ncbi:hypothetical protein DFH06DRAFT_128280 [Mycena polygramma]|nr:hypothetical protein DFH06DRAFT_128280 [Mycena polygramma]